jgi:hypothetical protein
MSGCHSKLRYSSPSVYPRKGRQPVYSRKGRQPVYPRKDRQSIPDRSDQPPPNQHAYPLRVTPCEYGRHDQSALQRPGPSHTLLRCRGRRHRPATRFTHVARPNRTGNLPSRSTSPSSDCRSHPRHTWPRFSAHSHHQHSYPHSHSPCSWLRPSNLLPNASNSFRCIFLGHRHATLCSRCWFNRRAPLFPLLATHQRSLGLYLHRPTRRSIHPPRLPLFVGHRTHNSTRYPQHPP